MYYASLIKHYYYCFNCIRSYLPLLQKETISSLPSILCLCPELPGAQQAEQPGETFLLVNLLSYSKEMLLQVITVHLACSILWLYACLWQYKICVILDQYTEGGGDTYLGWCIDLWMRQSERYWEKLMIVDLHRFYTNTKSLSTWTHPLSAVWRSAHGSCIRASRLLLLCLTLVCLSIY